MNHKVVLIGSFAVGKTSFIRRLVTGKFVTDPEPTIGCGFYRYTSPTGMAFDLWDTAGQERFRSIMPFYIRGADAILFTFDTSCPQTLQDIHTKWMPFVMQHSESTTAMHILIENKYDLACLEPTTDIINHATVDTVNYPALHAICATDNCVQPVSNGHSPNDVPLRTPQEVAAYHSMRHYRASPLFGTGLVEVFRDLERLLPKKQAMEIVNETLSVPQCPRQTRCCGQ